MSSFYLFEAENIICGKCIIYHPESLEHSYSTPWGTLEEKKWIKFNNYAQIDGVFFINNFYSKISCIRKKILSTTQTFNFILNASIKCFKLKKIYSSDDHWKYYACHTYSNFLIVTFLKSKKESCEII